VVVAFGDIALANVRVIHTIQILAVLESRNKGWVTAGVADEIVVESARIARDSGLKFWVSRTALRPSFFDEIDKCAEAENAIAGASDGRSAEMRANALNTKSAGLD